MAENQPVLFVRILIILAVMSATLMQVLDTTIVNVALPYMQGSLGTTSDEISWVLTSYLVASALFMPLSGYFTDTWGRRKYLLVSIIGFVAASALCGIAENLTQMVVFRLLQGVFGASLVPLSQAVMSDMFPREDQGKAMAIWGMGVMVGPILGPTLGGYLTEVANWRWNFYINLPIGALSLFLAWYFVPDTPRKSRSMDWTGFILLFVTICSFQYFLDRGNRDDWFDSTGICIAAFLSITGFLCFLLHSTRNKKNFIFDMAIFKDRNFAVSSILLAMFGLGLYGAMVILPMMLEGLFDYPVMTTGFVMAPRGISSMISIIMVGQLIKFTDARLLVGVGIVISCAGMFLGSLYNLDISSGWVIGPLIMQGFGLGMIFTPLSTIAFSTLAVRYRAEATGMFSLLRSLGSSMGISIVETLYTRYSQSSWNHLGGFLNPYNPALNSYTNSMNLKSETPLSLSLLQKELLRQAQMLSFVEIYTFISTSFLCMLPLLFLLKKQKQSKLPEIAVD
jgi:DHA2 family multidrug resistance protein